MKKEEIKKAIEALGLTYHAEFVPQKFSRNADSKTPSLNWRVTISKNGTFINTDYMQGIGHIPGYQKMDKGTKRKNEIDTVNTGKYYRRLENILPNKVPSPELIDVLYSLTLDMEACDYCGFEDWADSFGYDSDSIEHKKIYDDCLVIAKQFKKIVNLEEMRELFSEY